MQVRVTRPATGGCTRPRASGNLYSGGVTLQIRDGRPADAERLASVQVSSWRVSHDRVYPQAVLDSVTIEEREREWREMLNGPSSSKRLLVVEQDEVVVGLSSSGPDRDEAGPADIAEVYELFVDPSVIGTGVGHALLRATLDRLRRDGYESVGLWVAEGNALAQGFYEREGFQLDGATKRASFQGADVTEVRYRTSLASV